MLDAVGGHEIKIVPVSEGMLHDTVDAALNQPEPDWESPRADDWTRGGAWGSQRTILFGGLTCAYCLFTGDSSRRAPSPPLQYIDIHFCASSAMKKPWVSCALPCASLGRAKDAAVSCGAIFCGAMLQTPDEDSRLAAKGSGRLGQHAAGRKLTKRGCGRQDDCTGRGSGGVGGLWPATGMLCNGDGRGGQCPAGRSPCQCCQGIALLSCAYGLPCSPRKGWGVHGG